MRTKITLTMDGETTWLDEKCLQNWKDLQFSWKRSELSGVVRSCSSKFEFTGEAFDYLFAAYRNNKYLASVTVGIWTQNDRLGFIPAFSCALDFSTISIADGVLSISAVDDTLAAAIKAAKGTTYEIPVSELVEDRKVNFDRIPMSEKVEYKFTMGESRDDGSLLMELSQEDGNLVWLGSVADEISAGGTMYFKDDQETTEGSFMIQAYKEVDVQMGYTYTASNVRTGATAQRLYFERVSERGVVQERVQWFALDAGEYLDVGTYPDETALKNSYPDGVSSTDDLKMIAEVAGVIYRYAYNGQDGKWHWENSGKARADCSFLRRSFTNIKDWHMDSGDRIRCVIDWQNGSKVTETIYNSLIRFDWIARGDSVSLSAHEPQTVLNAIVHKMCDGWSTPIECSIAPDDTRLASTLIIPAETIRGIDGAKFYSSFTNFCDWMETVFAYTWRLTTKASPIRTDDTAEAAKFVEGGYYASAGIPSGGNIVYDKNKGCFLREWNDRLWDYDLDGYNDYSGAQPRPVAGKLFCIGYGKWYYFDTDTDGNTDPTPVRYYSDPAISRKEFSVVEFIPRTSLFPTGGETRVFSDAMGVKHGVDRNYIYSAVTAGYEKQDYDDTNGRDEFNFSLTFTTGCRVSEKTLTLISKYRADCYGMEFAAQKRRLTTTDGTEDKDVFFILVDADGNPDRSAQISGSLNADLFNAAFSPRACILANKAYISMQADFMVLKFASATGNSDISIDGTALTADITASATMLTADTVEFTTADLDVPDPTTPIVVQKRGVYYRGYISEVDLKFCREEAATYKLLLKTISPC